MNDKPSKSFNSTPTVPADLFTQNCTQKLPSSQMRIYLERVAPFDHEHVIVLGRLIPATGSQAKSWLQCGVRTCDEAEAVLLQESQKTPNANLYVSMGCFTLDKGATLPPGWTTLKSVREAGKAFALKSLFLDIDAGDDKAYKTSTEARNALDQFVSHARLMKPSMVVSSGGGLHIYWTFAETVFVAAWRPLAEVLKAATIKYGLKADPPVIADAARVLRPPDTFNTKDGTRRRVVILDQHGDVSPVEMAYALRAFMDANVVPLRPEGQQALQTILREPPKISSVFEGEFESLTGRGATPRDIDQVATACGFVRDTLATEGAGYSEPLWYWTMNIALFCREPEETARRLSCGHVRYTPEETAAKLAEAQDAKTKKDLGFIKCSTIRKTGATQCATCPHRDLDKSPLSVPGAFEPPPLKFVSDGGEWQPIKGGVYAATDETLSALNERWRYIKNGGLTLLYENKAIEGWFLSDEESMRRDLANVQVQIRSDNGNSKNENAASWFNKHPKRPPPANKVFLPNRKAGPNEFNFWQGWGIDPDLNYRDLKGKPKPELSTILSFIGKVVCKKDTKKIDSFIKLHAWIVQNPGKPPGVFTVLKSAQRGTGKNTFAKIMLKIFGKHGELFQNKEHFFGKHSVFEHLCYAVLDELLAEKDHKSNDLIKGRATGETIIIEPKYQQARSIRNTVAMLILSNHDNPVFSGARERRQLVLELDPGYVRNKQYFKELHDAIDNGGAEQFFGFLLAVELEDWTPNEIVRTAELAEQQIASLSSIEQWLLEMADADCLLGGIHEGQKLDRVFAIGVLREAFFERTKHTTDKISSRTIGNAFSKYFGKRVKCNNQSVGGNNPDMGYFVPNGVTLRVKVCEVAGIEIDP
jgi:hypothetical protein